VKLPVHPARVSPYSEQVSPRRLPSYRFNRSGHRNAGSVDDWVIELELGRSYVTITKELARVMSRIKALYRSWAIACSCTSVYPPRHRAEWLDNIPEPGVRLRAERFYQQLDLLQAVRQQARRALLTESRKHHAVKLLRQIPSLGPIRTALLVG